MSGEAERFDEWAEGVDVRATIAAKDKRLAEFEAALQKIASCEKRCDGDVVDIARKALGQ